MVGRGEAVCFVTSACVCTPCPILKGAPLASQAACTIRTHEWVCQAPACLVACGFIACCWVAGSSLSLLDVSRNGICRDGAFAIADMLQSPRCRLTDLLVAHNPLSPDGCAAIAASLKTACAASTSGVGVRASLFVLLARALRQPSLPLCLECRPMERSICREYRRLALPRVPHTHTHTGTHVHRC
jgi:hypothetical protein